MTSQTTADDPNGRATGGTLGPVLFADLVGMDRPPAGAEQALRTPLATHSHLDLLGDDPRNNGFLTGLVDRRRGARFKATRRGFLRSTIAAAAAATAVSAANVFGPARRVEAQTGIVGTYPRRIMQFCPPYNSNDNCQPGCGSSPICTDCCTSDGYFRNDPANGYSLNAGGCGDGDIADGWLWRYKGTCGSCAEIEYRCSDGYVRTDSGPAPFICRYVTDCVPLAAGAPTTQPLADAARPTNWRPAGALELVVDNVSSVTMNGWMADGSGRPLSMRIVANGAIVHLGTAAQPRPDIARTVSGAGPNTGFTVSFPLRAGQYRLCVDAIAGAVTSTIGCVNMNVGAGGSVRGSGRTGTIAPAPVPTRAAASPVPVGTPSPTPAAPTATTTPTVEAGPVVLPVAGTPSATPTYGAAQVIRRSGPTTGFASGWAGDADTDEAAFVEVTVDGESVAVARAELPRPDVAAAFDAMGAATGFAITFALPESSATVCIDAIGADDGRRQPLGCRTLGAQLAEADVASHAPPTANGPAAPVPAVVFGAIETTQMGGGGVTLTGWAFDPNDQGRSVEIEAESGSVAAAGSTGLPSPAARKVYGVASPCGFELALELAAGSHDITVEAITSDGGRSVIDQRTVTVP